MARRERCPLPRRPSSIRVGRMKNVSTYVSSPSPITTLPSLCLSETHTHRFLSALAYPSLLPSHYIYIYTYESIKCRLCLSGTKTLKLQIIGHFSCLSDSVLRVQLRRRDTRRKEQRRNRDPFVFVKKEKNFKAGAARVSATRGSLSIISALVGFSCPSHGYFFTQTCAFVLRILSDKIPSTGIILHPYRTRHAVNPNFSKISEYFDPLLRVSLRYIYIYFFERRRKEKERNC